MGKLITISNRLPFSFGKKNGRLSLESSAGGLATGLRSFYRSRPSAWIGWPGLPGSKITPEDEKQIVQNLTVESCRPVFLSGHEIEQYYYGFSNKTIWPLFHYFPLYAAYNKNYWTVYRRVNEKFCQAALEIAEPGDEIWIHDYHLLLLPALIKERLPGASVGFFLHIPFPSFEIFRLLPWREEIVRGMLGADLVGFHTFRYAHHFLDSVRHLIHYDHLNWQVNTGSRLVKVEALPMGIDYERFHSVVSTPEVQGEIAKIRKKLAGRKIILSVDRLDYTKGIPQRLEAFELFLEKNPEFREKVTLIMVAVPSRTAVEAYAQLKSRVDELVGRINGRYGTIGWIPIWYLYRFLPFKTLAAYYHAADIALVTPLRDGMNLIAKEFVAARTDRLGVLILSEMAGSAKELGDAILVNPNNHEEVAEAIGQAVRMPEEEQRSRMENMQKRLSRFTVLRWADEFMAELRKIRKIQEELAERKLDESTREKMAGEFRRARRALLLLDFDGTLVPFAARPEQAVPDEELKTLLRTLSGQAGSHVVVISGRTRKTLESWLGELDLSLIVEHGAWIRERGLEWATLEPAQADWKSEVAEVLNQYVDRTPGAFLEEKDFSLALHYRKVDAEIALLRMREVKEDLLTIASELNLEVLEGNKVLEVRNPGINKGRAALRLVSGKDWDFILAIGDDRTDEDLFAVLPETAYSIKVGMGPTRARNNLDDVTAVRSLLKKLARSEHE
ncbi:MAG: bifunctional alpha,alpha-trehalose-phosphate synthase (UDP-forming)/trehalose-phosphatase [Candidatus Aminicenantes bacterium]|nr:bifunctional alpha,alpha-trehalose-phosphate synthase (UDP-forming)/trehalose-phosphatase [Candidatus Aminicenantes bacterium]